MDKQTLKVQRKYDRYSHVYDWFETIIERGTFSKWRKNLLKKLKGKILMLEHVLSKYFLIRIFQHLHNPITKFLFGFNVNRDTLRNIKKSGLKLRYKNLALFDVFKKIEAVK